MIAYLVCTSAGVDTDDYSSPNIARWSNGDLELIRKIAERAIGRAWRILQETGLVGAKAPLEVTV